MNSWPTVALGKAAEIAAGGGAPQNSNDFGDVGTPFVRAGSLNKLTEGAAESSLELLNEAVAKKHRLRLFPAGSILFAKSGMSATKGLVYRLASSAYVVNHLAVVMCRSDLDSSYLRHCLRVFSPTCLIQDPAYPSIRLSDIETMKIPLPPLSEQKRIADILDRAEALRAKRRATLTQIDELTQAIFIDIFGDPLTNLERWRTKPLRELVNEFRYGTSNKSQAEGKVTLRIPNVIGGTIDYSALKLVPVDTAEFNRLKLVDGDILFVRTNGNPDFVGRCAVFDRETARKSGFDADEFIFASYLIRARLRMDQVTSIFLREFMLGARGRRELRSRCKTSAGQFNINTENLGAIAVPLPPLNLQQEFARRLLAIEKLKTAHKASLAEIDELFASLQYRAFKGEL